MVAIQIAPEQNNLLRDWRAKGKYTFPVLLVPPHARVNGAVEYYAIAKYGLWSEPTNILLNRAHEQVFRHVAGAGTALEAEIRETLGLSPFEGLEPTAKSSKDF